MSSYGDTNINGYQGQIKASDQPNGYFSAGTEVIILIAQACNNQYSGTIKRLGIESPEGTSLLINNKDIKIGKTGMYEVRDVDITSLIFVEDSAKQAVVDYII